MKDLEGRVAVVAGATRGAGRSTTNFFSGNGVLVAAEGGHYQNSD